MMPILTQLVGMVVALPLGSSAASDPPLSERITFELATDRRSYIVGEPVEFRFVRRNKSSSLYRGSSFHPFNSSWAVNVKRGDTRSRELRLSPGSGDGDMEWVRCKLAPKESFSEHGVFAFDYGAGALILDEPGTYAFKATYSDSPGGPDATVESNVWTVEVEAALDRYRDAFEAYRKLDVASLITWPMYFIDLDSKEVLAAFEFLERYPDSPWAKYVRKGLTPALESRVGRRLASPEETQVLQMLREREAAEEQATP